MQGSYERCKLLEHYSEPRNALPTLARCVAGFLVVICLSLSVEPGRGALQGAVVARSPHPAEAHRKQVFEERRNRHVNQEPARKPHKLFAPTRMPRITRVL